MGKGFYNTTKTKPQTFTRPVSFAHCENPEEKEKYCIQLRKDNIIFLNSVLSLLTDKDYPFLQKKYLDDFNNFRNSKRPEIKDRVQTLKYIIDNRGAWFEDGSVTYKRLNMITIFEYLMKNSVLLYYAPEYFNQDIDVNLAVKKAISDPNFNFQSSQNQIKKSWDTLAIKLKEVYKPQDLSPTSQNK